MLHEADSVALATILHSPFRSNGNRHPAAGGDEASKEIVVTRATGREANGRVINEDDCPLFTQMVGCARRESLKKLDATWAEDELPEPLSSQPTYTKQPARQCRHLCSRRRRAAGPMARPLQNPRQ